MKFLVVALLCSLTTGCIMQKGTYFGEIKNPVLTNETIDSDEYKYNFRYLMTSNERNHLYTWLYQKNYVADKFNYDRTNDGASAVTAQAFGGDGLGKSGVALSLVAGIGDSIIQKLSARSIINGYNIPQVDIDVAKNNNVTLHQHLFEKTISTIKNTAKELNYSIKCISRCTNHTNPTFELTNNDTNINIEGLYRPKKLVITTRLGDQPFINSTDDIVSEKVISPNYPIQTKTNNWIIILANPVDLDEKGEVIYMELVNKDQTVPNRINYMTATPLGRSFYRLISKELEGWYFGSNINYGKVAFLKGKAYALKNLDDYKRFHGIEAID